MTATQHPGHRLLHLASCLSSSRPLSAGLVLLSASSSRARLPPATRAHALLSAARHFLRAGAPARARSALARAVLAFEGAAVLDAGGAAEARAAILQADGDARVVGQALEGLVRGEERDGGVAWDWWVFFKAQEGGGRDVGRECFREGKVVAGVGFLLIEAQKRLGKAKGRGAGGVLEEARIALGEVEDGRDVALLKVACGVLKALERLRVGDAGAVRAGASALMEDFDRARSASGRGVTEQWKWLSGKILRSLVHHILACAARGTGDGSVALKYATGALGWAGMDDSGRTAEGRPFSGRLDAAAESAMSIVLIESAARCRLERVELVDAGALVQQCMDIINAQTVAVRSQAAVYLLVAEWYMQYGSFTGAQRATRYIARVVEGTKESSEMRAELGDITQMARTYESLLTGEKRLTGLGPDATADANEYVNGAVRAAAYFAEGVHDLRQSNVLDAKHALVEGLGLCGKDSSATSEQVAVNICSTLASLYSSYSGIAEDTKSIVSAAVYSPDVRSDLVTQARTLRMQTKLANREEVVDCKVVSLLDAQRAENERLLAERQVAVQQAFS